jgi:hypothetical protein
MTSMTRGLLGCLSLVALAGCAGSPAAPFDQMKSANVIAFRLQNWEPPPTTALPAPGGAAGVPGIPPQIQQWIQQGAQGLQQLIPPGLLPPGMIPPGGAAPIPTTAPAPVDTAPRFPVDSQPNYRILSQTPVVDPDLKDKLASIFGHESNFQAQNGGCMYPEFGVTFQTPPQPANNVLVSFSCGQVQARNFAWPHPYTGLKDGTVKDLREVIGKIFPAGT